MSYKILMNDASIEEGFVRTLGDNNAMHYYCDSDPALLSTTKHIGRQSSLNTVFWQNVTKIWGHRTSCLIISTWHLGMDLSRSWILIMIMGSCVINVAISQSRLSWMLPVCRFAKTSILYPHCSSRRQYKNLS